MSLLDRILGPRVKSPEVKEYQQLSAHAEDGRRGMSAGEARRLTELRGSLGAAVTRELDRRAGGR